ncbi:MAG: type II secretion system protein [Alphaproteobacteria bacterium]|nr:type II secretion system protein [Alphaproteobacteria bacterium]
MINKNEQGRTMLEMLGVIAIMGIITFGAITGINYGMTSYKISQTYNEVQNTIEGVKDLYSWSKVYPSDASKIKGVVEDNDVFPGAKVGDYFKGQFGKVDIQPIDGGYNFAVIYYGINGDDCERLINLDWETSFIEAKVISCTGDCQSTDKCGGEDSVNTLSFSPI